MVNPQIEDGHVDIANEIVEALAKIRISGEEVQVLWVVFRQTYGWHKKEDWISLQQFTLFTGIKKSSICRALSKLIMKNIINKKVNKDSTTYGFQKNYSKWKPLTKKITLTKKIISIDKKVNSPLTKKRHTKETITKETITKESKHCDEAVDKKDNAPLTMPEIKVFIDFYHDEFKNRFGTPPHIQGGKDSSIVKQLLKRMSLEELKELLLRFFESSDKFIQTSGYTMGIFNSQINKLKIGAGEKHSGLRAWAQEIVEEEQSGRE